MDFFLTNRSNCPGLHFTWRSEVAAADVASMHVRCWRLWLWLFSLGNAGSAFSSGGRGAAGGSRLAFATPCSPAPAQWGLLSCLGAAGVHHIVAFVPVGPVHHPFAPGRHTLSLFRQSHTRSFMTRGVDAGDGRSAESAEPDLLASFDERPQSPSSSWGVAGDGKRADGYQDRDWRVSIPKDMAKYRDLETLMIVLEDALIDESRGRAPPTGMNVCVRTWL